MICLIAAYTKNRVIGKNGKIPWNIEGEKSHFKNLTTGNIVVMGRKTFEEIGRPLPERITIIVSSSAALDKHICSTCFRVTSLEEAISLSTTIAPEKHIFICGGAKLYAAALPLVEKMYITKINLELSGDTFFPVFDESEFTALTEEHKENIPAAELGLVSFDYITYTRKK
ncbi:MAG: dihydrofolate reductase [Treponema sp.]|nr:dihydrofolate reductase [Treponema sp.]